MIRTQVYIPDELYHQAKLFAELEGVSISEFMREGLQLKLQGRRKKSVKMKSKKSNNPLAAMVGKYSTGKGKVTTAAIDHNDIYDLVIHEPRNPVR